MSSSPRIACSPACAEILAKSDRVVDLTLRKSAQFAGASAYGCYLLGFIFIVFAVYGHRIYPSMRLEIPLMAVMGLGIMLWGVWYHRAAGRL